MDFQTQVAKDAEAIIDTGEFSVAITYTPKGGVAKSINACVGAIDIDIENCL